MRNYVTAVHENYERNQKLIKDILNAHRRDMPSLITDGLLNINRKNIPIGIATYPGGILYSNVSSYHVQRLLLEINAIE